MFGQDVTTTSANGLQVTTQSDIDGVGGFDFSQTNLKEVFGDLSTRVTNTTLNANGSLELAIHHECQRRPPHGYHHD